MKFKKKVNKPRKRRSPYSKEYIEARREEMYQLLGQAKTESERDAIIKAFNASINP